MDQDQNITPVKEQSIKQQVVEHLKNANNVLVTVSNNPTLDQLSACIGFTLMMNKLDKHATAVFSGAIPPMLDFLEPEKTLEMNTDSLRDFIISLDKSKADKLRYKVEDDVVRIYITPYRTSISGDDLEFTQGDFNVDVVVALGVENKDHLDQAIIDHGRILHDAVVIGVSCGVGRTTELGSVNWHEDSASSLSEMLVSISESFKTGLLDSQMSTAFLTGIVAETDRFSNDRTTPKVMTMSAQLMAAGANQQLIANQLAIKPIEPEPVAETPRDEESVESGQVEDPGVLHVNQELPIPIPAVEQDNGIDVNNVVQGSRDNGIAFSVHEEEEIPAPVETVTPDDAVIQPPEIEIDEHGNMVDLVEQEEERASHRQKIIQPIGGPAEPLQKTNLSSYIFEAPANGGTLTANSVPEYEQPDPSLDPLASPVTDTPIMDHNGPQQDDTEIQDRPEQTLAELEKAVDSPHLAESAQEARNAIADAVDDYVPNPADQIPDDQQKEAPPELPPPFLPPVAQPRTGADGELNLPTPQQ